MTRSPSQAPLSEATREALPRLATALIRCESVTPRSARSYDVLQDFLEAAGFRFLQATFGETSGADASGMDRKPAQGVDNWLATAGTGGTHLLFAGHVDVVPAGALSDWRHPPFSGTVDGDELYGRGAVDMKGGVAAFAAAAREFVTAGGLANGRGQISLVLTSDEEGPAIHGIKQFMPWLEARGYRFDACLIGEPTSEGSIGDAIKIGRRGSTSGCLTIRGSSGHSAYPHRCLNPLVPLANAIATLSATPLDSSTPAFAASSLSWIEAGSRPTASAWNVTPAEAFARFNIRWNDNWNADSLEAHMRRRIETMVPAGFTADITFLRPVSHAFVTAPGPLSRHMENAIVSVVGRKPRVNTDGGTSDGRFLHRFCPTVECGPLNQTMHAANERISLDDLATLCQIYRAFLDRFFANT